MTQYIDKSVLVAELKNRIRDYWSDTENTMGIYPYALEEVIKYVDTLEVKEINSTDAFIRKARKYFYKELPNFRSFMESGTAFIKNFESFIQGE